MRYAAKPWAQNDPQHFCVQVIYNIAPQSLHKLICPQLSDTLLHNAEEGASYMIAFQKLHGRKVLKASRTGECWETRVAQSIDLQTRSKCVFDYPTPSGMWLPK